MSEERGVSDLSRALIRRRNGDRQPVSDRSERSPQNSPTTVIPIFLSGFSFFNRAVIRRDFTFSHREKISQFCSAKLFHRFS